MYLLRFSVSRYLPDFRKTFSRNYSDSKPDDHFFYIVIRLNFEVLAKEIVILPLKSSCK